MGRSGKNPHDALFVDTFGQPEHAGDLIAAVLPKDVAVHLDLSTIERRPEHFVDDKLRGLESDLLFRLRAAGGDSECFVYVLLEHQSTVDPAMPFRLLAYMVRIWDRWRREHGMDHRLPPIVPVVLSHAPGGWTAARRLVDLIDGPPELLDALGLHLPDFTPILEDLEARSDDELLEMQATALARLVLWLLKHGRDPDVLTRLSEQAETVRQVFLGGGLGALLRALVYTMEVSADTTVDDYGWVDRALGLPPGEVAMTLAEKLRDEGRTQGRTQGRQEGREEGRLRQASVTLKLLRLRFGPLPENLEAHTRAADPDELERLAERALTAETIEDVLR